MLLKCCTQHGSKFGKLTSGHRTGKSQFSFQSQKRTSFSYLLIPGRWILLSYFCFSSHLTILSHLFFPIGLKIILRSSKKPGIWTLTFPISELNQFNLPIPRPVDRSSTDHILVLPDSTAFPPPHTLMWCQAPVTAQPHPQQFNFCHLYERKLLTKI